MISTASDSLFITVTYTILLILLFLTCQEIKYCFQVSKIWITSKFGQQIRGIRTQHIIEVL